MKISKNKMTIVTALIFALNLKALAAGSTEASAKNTPKPAPLAAETTTEKTIQFKAANGKVEFTAIGKPAMIKINGEGEGPAGTATVNKDILNANLTVNLEKVTTKIDLRDDHMKNKYLEVAKFPTATLVIKDFKMAKPFETLGDKETELPFSGELTLHGKTKPVTGMALVTKADKQISGTADFTFKIMEHLDTLPSWAGVKVADEVKIKVQFKGAM